MNEVQKLIDARRKSTATCFLRFTLATGESGIDAVYFFIEGRDAPYYYPRIKHFIGKDELVPIPCGGKKNVIGIFNILKCSTYIKYKKLFFVDADFDNNLELPDDIFVTPCYSIENLYVTENVLREILKCEFEMMHSDECFKKILLLFNEQLNIFNDITLEFNAWYSVMKNNHSEYKINLDEKFPKDFILLKIRNMEKKYTLDDIKSKFNSCEISQECLQREVDKIKISRGMMFRGKYQKQFFIEFLKFIIDDANIESKRLFCNRKTHFRVDPAQFLSQISQYAEMPSTLDDYIKDRIKNYKLESQSSIAAI